MCRLFSSQKLFFFALIALLSASCSTKQKKEESVADSTRQSIAKVEPPKAKDSVVEKPVGKKEIKSTVQPKKVTILPVKTEEKREPVKETVKEPVKETPPVKEPVKESVPVKEDVVVVTPPAKEEVAKVAP